MTEHNELCKKWAKDVEKLLLGKTIVKVRYMTQKEMKDHMWNNSAVVLVLNDGTVLYPSADDEGNNAGAIFTTNDELPVIPVI